MLASVIYFYDVLQHEVLELVQQDHITREIIQSTTQSIHGRTHDSMKQFELIRSI